MNQAIEKDSPENIFFEKDAKLVEQKFVAIHTNGLNELLDLEVLENHKSDIA